MPPASATTSPARGAEGAGDRTLVEALLGGDERAVAEVTAWIRLAATPYRDLWQGELEDLQQEALLALLAALRGGRFRGTSSLRTYTRMLVHHRCIDRLRGARRRRARVDLAELELAAPEESALDSLEGAERTRLALVVLARTPAGCRELWRLVLAGKSYEEMAAQLGVAAGTLRVRVLRCRRRAVELRDELLRGGNAGSPPSTPALGGEEGER